MNDYVNPLAGEFAAGPLAMYMYFVTIKQYCLFYSCALQE